MIEKNSGSIANKNNRIISIDILRGLTILIMIFVNDLASVGGTPKWMLHYFPYDADGMTFVDVVFPAFLFIVGMSIPFAIGRRLKKGEPIFSIWKHILIRTLGLVIIGVFMVNSYSYAEKGILSYNVWSVLMYLGVIFVWNTIPKDDSPRRKIVVILKFVGIAMLIILAFLYRRKGGEGFFQMKTEWWGILGLIGWAYIGSCLIYTIFYRNLAAIMGMMGLFYCVSLADKAGLFWGFLPDKYVHIGLIFGSHAGITLSGIFLGMLLTPDSEVNTHLKRLKWGFFYGLGLIVAGILLHQLKDIHKMFIINKNSATVPWCLICSGITSWVWCLIYLMTDVKGWKKWSVVLEPAGENPLFAYILQPMLNSLIGLSAVLLGGFNIQDKLGEPFTLGLFRAIIFAFFVTWLSGYLKKIGVRLKL